MAHPSSPRPFWLDVIARMVAVCALVGVGGSGCERVSYWSGTTEPDEDPPEASGGGVTSSQSTGAGVSVDEKMVLRSVATCAVELYGQLATRTGDLARATAAAAASRDEVDRDEARAAWLATMDVWEQAEAIRVGPVGPAALPGGSGARDEIYAWPMTNRCLVEQTIVSRAYEDVDFGDFSLVNVRGLGAAEYLIFYEGTNNACAPTTSINVTGAWDRIDDDELLARKLDYAAAVSVALDLRTRQVDAAWRSDGDDFAEALAASGTEGAPFATTHAAVQALFTGLATVVRQLRDDKLAAPLDDPGCAGAPCATVEAPFAHASAGLARRGIDGVARVFAGCAAGDGVGLDDLLVARGHDDVARRASAALEAAAASLAVLGDGDLTSSLGSDRAAVEAALAAVTALGELFEGEVAQALELETLT